MVRVELQDDLELRDGLGSFDPGPMDDPASVDQEEADAPALVVPELVVDSAADLGLVAVVYPETPDEQGTVVHPSGIGHPGQLLAVPHLLEAPLLPLDGLGPLEPL